MQMLMPDEGQIIVLDFVEDAVKSCLEELYKFVRYNLKWRS